MRAARVRLASLASNGYEPFESGFGSAREAAERAKALEPELAEAWLRLAYITYAVDLDIAKARGQYDRALALDPGSAEVQGLYSNFASGIGQTEKAIEAGSKAVQLDPIAPRPHVALATAYYGARRYDEALAVGRRAERLDPNYPNVHGSIGYALLETGDLEGARAEFEKEPIEWQRLTGLALVAAKLGHAEQARAGLATALGRLGEAAAYQYAEINAQLGDHDEAFRWLGVAQQDQGPGIEHRRYRSSDGSVARRSTIQEADARARVRCTRPPWLIGFPRRAWPRRRTWNMKLDLGGALTAAALLTVAAVAVASPEDDRASVAALDTQYQAAVKRNDAETMGRILADDFVLVLGNGKTYTRQDLLESARAGKIVYERQDEDEGTQIVRVWGDTAVVTARLWLKGVNEGVAFERRLWFSDTYVRTPTGWRYAFGQASLPLPATTPAAEAKPGGQ